jgi:N-acetylglucosaminyldiphosphoundecaprenol N-acetyl-beta-D-mannosaminyltransferase
MKIKELIFKIENITFDKALEYIVENAQKKGTKRFIVTINTELVMLAKKDPRYEEVLKSADLAVVDGIGVVWAGKIFGKRFPERIHGVDLVERLARSVANLPAGRQEKPITVGFLGGKENVAQRASECLRNKYPGLRVAFAESEWPGLEANQEKVSSIKYQVLSKEEDNRHNTKYIIPNTRIDILFVAFGSPKQEYWISENLSKIDVKVAIGVGGSFDFISGQVRRAPVWMRKIGLEWLFRLIIQPWRIKRQTALVIFVIEVLKERLLRN